VKVRLQTAVLDCQARFEISSFQGRRGSIASEPGIGCAWRSGQTGSGFGPAARSGM